MLYMWSDIYIFIIRQGHIYIYIYYKQKYTSIAIGNVVNYVKDPSDEQAKVPIHWVATPLLNEDGQEETTLLGLVICVSSYLYMYIYICVRI